MAQLTVNGLDGYIGDEIRYHYDALADVMYIRRTDSASKESYGEETDDGFILLRTRAEDDLVGITIVGYWERFGAGRFEDAPVHEVIERVQDFAERMLQPAA